MLLAERLKRPDVSTVRVRVKGGYQPATVYGRVGEPLRIVFSRQESASCSEHVVFPAFGKSAMLPAFEDVTLELVPEHAGEFEFTCQLGMLRGRLVVADRAGQPPSQDAAPMRTARAAWASSIMGEPGDAALVTFAVWLCSIPLLLLASVPFLGWRTGGLLALAWLAVVAGVCFAVCVRRVHAPNTRRYR
jgi:hypothetical protein